MKERYAILGNRFICNSEEKFIWENDRGRNISNQVVSTYLVLRSIFYDGNKQHATVSLASLYVAFGVENTDWNITKPIRESMQALWANGYIKFYKLIVDEELNYEDICLMGYCFRVKFSAEDEEGRFNGFGGFTRIPEPNTRELLAYLHRTPDVQKYKLIRYYTIIARVCSNERMTGYISQEKLGELFGFSKSTCAKYNEILAELGLIYYNSGYGKYNKDLKRVITSCTFFGHRGAVNKFGETLTESDWVDAVEQMVSESNYRHVEMGNVVELVCQEG